MDAKIAMKYVTDKFAKQGITPYKINDGCCEEWAEEVFKMLKNSTHNVEMWETVFDDADTNHIFLKIDNLFHDAEEHKGTEEFDKLPIFVKLKKHTKRPQPVWRIDHNGNPKGKSRHNCKGSYEEE